VRMTSSIARARRPVFGTAALLLVAAAGVIAPTVASAAPGPTAVTPDGGPVSRGTGWGELKPSQSGEARHYWCGPAALVSTLKEDGRGTYTQTWAAGVLHTTTGGTDMGPMLTALNKYAGGFIYDQVNVPASGYSAYVSTYEGHLMADINAGYGLVGDVHEVPGGPHLAGHPVSEEIFHYIAIDGYFNSGSTTHYADPATTVWSAVKPYANISSALLIRIIADHGYYW